MDRINGLGMKHSPLQQTKNSSNEKTERTGQRPPAPSPNYDKYSMSEEAVARYTSIVEEEEVETLFDYMDTDIDYEALGITEEDMDFSEIEEFEDIDYVSDEEADVDVESDEGYDIEIVPDIVLGEDTEEEGDVEDSDTDSSPVDTTVRVHGYVSSLTEADREMLAIAYQANEMLTLEGKSLFDYLGDDADWFGTDWDASTSADSVDWDSLMESLGNVTGNVTEEDEDDTVEEDSDVIDPVEDSEILEDDAVDSVVDENATDSVADQDNTEEEVPSEE
ncbi:MAG: hypothetical protein R3Y63_03790 [Eubacteriales bacterium]